MFAYVSQKMLSEGSEKTWDQCRVKLKNLKSQWRYVRDRVPGIEEADMEDEDVVRQVMTDCQNRGVSPTCVKHLRYGRSHPPCGRIFITVLVPSVKEN